jgi:HK97 family phage portal protein
MFKTLSRFFGSKEESSIDLSKASASEVAMLSRGVANTKERNFIEMRLGVPINRFSDFNSYMETGHKRVWATFRACKIIASTLMSAKFKVVRKGKKIDNDVTAKFGEFLSMPNPFDSWEELMEMFVFHMELTGNAYWLKDEKDLKGRPKYLYPLLPQYMKVVPDEHKRISKYQYSVNGRQIDFDPEDIIHFRSTHPTSLILGMGSIEPSQAIYNEYINKSQLAEEFIKNGAQLSGILTRETEVSDEGQWAALKRKFNLEYGGKGNSGKIAFLNGKWQYHKLGMTMSEMQALEKEKWTIEQIFLNHGVPLSVAGIDGAANYATARQDEINFRKYKVVPLLDALVGKLNSDGFISPDDLTVRLTYEMSGLVDIMQVVKEYGPLVDKGAMTPNELREMCDLPIVDNPLLDQFYVMNNRIPIEMAGLSLSQAPTDPNNPDGNQDGNGGPDANTDQGNGDKPDAGGDNNPSGESNTPNNPKP